MGKKPIALIFYLEGYMEDVSKNPAVIVAKEGDESEEKIITLRSGVRVRLKPVPDMVVQRAMAKINKPKVPMWFNPDKEREEPNPNDPDYLEAVRRAEEERGMVAMDVSIMFGCELIDPIPDDRKWVQRLRKVAGIEVDDSDEFELEFAYLKYVAFANSADMNYVTGLDMTEADVENAGATFRSDETRGANSNGRIKERHKS